MIDNNLAFLKGDVSNGSICIFMLFWNANATQMMMHSNARCHVSTLIVEETSYVHNIRHRSCDRATLNIV